jgi:hypothetical protein
MAPQIATENRPATIAPPTEDDLAALLAHALAAWHCCDWAYRVGSHKAIEAAHAEFMDRATAYHEAEKAHQRARMEAEHGE